MELNDDDSRFGEYPVKSLDVQDPMDRAFIRMIMMNQKKRADYAGTDPFSNFRKVAEMMQLDGYDHIEDCMTMVCRKIARINNLRGRDPQNESVIDSYEDLAVYATLMFAMVLERAGQATKDVAYADREYAHDREYGNK